MRHTIELIPIPDVPKAMHAHLPANMADTLKADSGGVPISRIDQFEVGQIVVPERAFARFGQLEEKAGGDLGYLLCKEWDGQLNPIGVGTITQREVVRRTRRVGGARESLGNLVLVSAVTTGGLENIQESYHRMVVEAYGVHGHDTVSAVEPLSSPDVVRELINNVFETSVRSELLSVGSQKIGRKMDLFQI